MSVDDHLSDLFRRAADSMGVPAPVDPAALSRRARLRQRTRWGAVAGTVAVAGVVTAAVALPRPDRDDRQPVAAGPATRVTEPAGLQPGWNRLADPPLSARSRAVVAATDDEIVVVGGSDFLCPPAADCVGPPNPPFTDGAAFDLATFVWRPIAAAPAGVEGERAVVVQGAVYVLAPCESTVQSACERSLLRYDPDADRWSTRAAVLDGEGYALIEAEGDLIAYSTSDESGERPDYVFDQVSDSWSPLPDDPLPETYDRFVVCDGVYLMVFAKEVSVASDSDVPPVLVARFDLAESQWDDLPPGPTSGYQAWLLDGDVVVNPHFGTPEGGIFSPATGEWRPLPPDPPAESWRGDMAGALGEDAAVFEYAHGWVLDLPAESWIEVPDVDGGNPRANPGVTASERDLFVFGGEHWSGTDGELLGEAWLWLASSS